MKNRLSFLVILLNLNSLTHLLKVFFPEEVEIDGLDSGSPVNIDQAADEHSTHDKTQESSVLVHIFFHVSIPFQLIPLFSFFNRTQFIFKI